jgi:hypothetical protein
MILTNTPTFQFYALPSAHKAAIDVDLSIEHLSLLFAKNWNTHFTSGSKIKKLKYLTGDFYRMRKHKTRIIFSKINEFIFFHIVDQRSDIYESEAFDTRLKAFDSMVGGDGSFSVGNVKEFGYEKVLLPNIPNDKIDDSDIFFCTLVASPTRNVFWFCIDR